MAAPPTTTATRDRGLTLQLTGFSLLLLVAGVVTCVLVSLTATSAQQFINDLNIGHVYRFGTGNWYFGFGFIIVASSCVSSGFRQTQRSFLVLSAFSLLAVIGYLVWMIKLIDAVTQLNVHEFMNVCLYRHSCLDMKSNMQGLTVCVSLGWFFTVVVFFISCYKVRQLRVTAQQPPSQVVIPQLPPTQVVISSLSPPTLPTAQPVGGKIPVAGMDVFPTAGHFCPPPPYTPGRDTCDFD